MGGCNLCGVGCGHEEEHLPVPRGGEGGHGVHVGPLDSAQVFRPGFPAAGAGSDQVFPHVINGNLAFVIGRPKSSQSLDARIFLDIHQVVWKGMEFLVF